MSTNQVNPLSSVFAASPESQRSNSTQSDPGSSPARPAATGNERQELNAYFDELQESIHKIEQTLRENYQRSLETVNNVREKVENRRARSLRGETLICVCFHLTDLFFGPGLPTGAPASLREPPTIDTALVMIMTMIIMMMMMTIWW